MYLDYTYVIFVIPALLIGLWAQAKVKSTFAKYSKVFSSRGYTGAQVSQFILEQNGINNVAIQRISGSLTDNYNPQNHVISLSEDVYGSTSVAAIGVAAHETGHAIQHDVGYFPIKLREAVIPVTQIGSKLYLPIILIGCVLSMQSLLDLGIILFATIALFQLITLPVEFNASSRALKTLESYNVLDKGELSGARKVLSAAAMTYVAALLSSLGQLIRFIILFGGNRRRN